MNGNLRWYRDGNGNFFWSGGVVSRGELGYWQTKLHAADKMINRRSWLMRSIFISYRRGDAEGQAGRLFDDLAAHFGKTAVFMDVEDIEPGRDFRKVIDQHVSSCGVLLALVGKGWLDATDPEGRRRLDDPNDFVRLETASALKRDIPVIPVLVQGATMPKPDSLPDDLKEFAFRNAVELTHARWESDVQLLIKALGSFVDVGKQHEQPAPAKTDSDAAAKASSTTVISSIDKPEAQLSATASASPQSKKAWLPILIAAIVAIAFAAGGYMIYDNTKKAAEEQKVAAAKAEGERIASEKAAEEQRIAAEKAAAERAATEQAVAKENAAIEQVKKERLKAQKDAENARRLAALAEEKRLRAESEKAAAERAAEAKRGNTATGATATDSIPKKHKKAKKASSHFITNFTFDPPTGSIIRNNRLVNVSFSYTTVQADGVRIFALPLTGGHPTHNLLYGKSPLYRTGSYNGKGSFTISSGNVVVDSVILVMTDKSGNQRLYSTVIPAKYEFR